MKGTTTVTHTRIDETLPEGSCAQHRDGPERALRRIDGLEADRRRVLRSLDRCTPGSDLAGELARQVGELDEQLAHWRDVVAKAVAGGFKVWSRDDFQRGDFVRYRGTWFEVLRVNAKSVTIPHILDGDRRDVIQAQDGHRDCTWTARYHDGITGRMSAAAMVRRLTAEDGRG